ncbi:hypothetical protein JST97_36845 [bacterium]|nr:hypothetical protein [bacterium]
MRIGRCGRGHARGLSIAEAVVAMFILLGGFTVLFRLFHTAMHYSNIVEAQQNKVRIGLNKLEEIRAWSRSVHQPVGTVPFDAQWPYWHDQTGVDDENPEIRWKVQVLQHTLYSPCESFESIKASSERRRMTRSCKQVVVMVNNGDPEAAGIGMFAQPVVLTALIGQPSIAPIPDGSVPPLVTNMSVSVAGPSVTMKVGDPPSPSYTASLNTNSGYEILDVFFFWNTLGDAAGTIVGTGSGTSSTVKVEHKILIPDGPPIHSVPGTCRAWATCKFRGYTLAAPASGTITLQD